jgi:hypothetical protein
MVQTHGNADLFMVPSVAFAPLAIIMHAMLRDGTHFISA